MKKLSRVLAVLLVALMLISSVAFAEGLSISASYSDGMVRWKASGYSMSYKVSFGGWSSGTCLVPEGSHAINLTSPTTITITADGTSASAPIKGISAVEPTDAPVEPTDAPVEPTDAPVEPTDAPVEPTDAPVEPTDAPVEPTDAPVEPTDAPVEPTEAPTQAPADDDDEVPKTGDSATASFLMGGAMVLAAAYLLLRRRVHSK